MRRRHGLVMLALLAAAGCAAESKGGGDSAAGGGDEGAAGDEGDGAEGGDEGTEGGDEGTAGGDDGGDDGEELPPAVDLRCPEDVLALPMRASLRATETTGHTGSVRFIWSLVAAPHDAQLGSGAFTAGSGEQMLFLQLAGDYTVEVVASVDGLESAPASCSFSAAHETALAVEHIGTADPGTYLDHDLHLAHGGAELFFTPGDASYCNSPDPGPDEAEGTADDLYQVLDDRTGGAFAVELFQAEAIGATTYTPRVHLFNADSQGEDEEWRSEVRVWVDGVEVARESSTELTEGDVWEVGTYDAVAETWTAGETPPAAAERNSCVSAE